MSRIGKIPVSVPKEAKVAIEGKHVRLEGAKGKLGLDIPAGIKVEQKDNQLFIQRESDTKQCRANHGTIRALLKNMIMGVTIGHRQELEIQGVGFRALLKGKQIVFSLGLSHPVEFNIPEGVKVEVPTQTAIKIEGCDKSLVGQVAANIRQLKPAEPYKGKGIRYVGEVVRRKQGKSVTKQ